MPKKTASENENKTNGANLGFETQMWAAADKLRGRMDASEYKHVTNRKKQHKPFWSRRKFSVKNGLQHDSGDQPIAKYVKKFANSNFHKKV
jgi:hypothetical protein